MLERTPAVMRSLLLDAPDAWLRANEGEGTWCGFDVVGHLVHGERTDWIVRARQIVEVGDAEPFEPFDRGGHEQWWSGRTIGELLDELERLRTDNLRELRAMGLSDETLDRAGRHPDLGPVTLRQLLATWVVHDLHHLAQIARVMAKRYTGEVGPWSAYLGVLGPS